MIRQALKQDKKDAASLIYQAIHDIAHVLTAETEYQKVLAELEILFSSEGNRISYKNCLIAEDEGQIAGIVVSYPGKYAEKFDEAIKSYLLAKKGYAPVIDKETDETDYYIDTVSVHSSFRNHGIGTSLLKAAITKGKKAGYRTISLVVDVNNKQARKLYERIGFIYKKSISIHHHDYDYLVKEVH
ncbi:MULTISPECIES: GNAT family N-acetyltransferase [Bacillaceae]|jgi:ribosomal protein S18 acetylase RimI-like enzyme|uniref:N-acetyltransferase domain-containing protein n=2 Tax=Bacillaceae TaxID=186817 RepID=A0A090IYU2_9BACI|nr:GNAT family N-acetyltransferase [Caldibacillus thermoamylovorans]CEE01603.1 hypothetical protein BT1A1_1777 [Caldibacillus thermoamylovorans]